MIESLNRQRIVSLLGLFYRGNIEAALGRLTDDVKFLADAPVGILAYHDDEIAIEREHVRRRDS